LLLSLSPLTHWSSAACYGCPRADVPHEGRHCGGGEKTRSELDLDHDLQESGLASLIPAGLGGYVGYVLISWTILKRNLGRRSAFSGLIVGGVCAVAIFAGSEISGMLYDLTQV